MKKSMQKLSFLFLLFFISPAFAEYSSTLAPYLQIIQIVNMLFNSGISNAGMTPTSVTVQFIDSVTTRSCWSTILTYQSDFTLRSGAKQNCINPVSQVIITPIVVAGVLQTYTGPLTVPIDPTKYATQITIVQDVAPVFDDASGLVATPGTMKSNVQAQLRD